MRHRGGHIANRCHHARADVVRRSGRAIRVRALEGAVGRSWDDEKEFEEMYKSVYSKVKGMHEK